MIKEKSSKREGTLLIEAMVAITVIIFGLFSIMTLVSRSLSLNRVVSDRYIAANLAAEGVELVKNIVDTNVLNPPYVFNEGLGDGDYEIDYSIVALSAFGNRYLKYDPATGYTYTNGIETRFKRRINITNEIDFIKVKSIVTWKTRGDFKIEVEDRFYNWR